MDPHVTFFLCAALLWIIVIAYMVNQKNPEITKNYISVATSKNGIIALVICLLISYMLFIKKNIVENARPVLMNTLPPGPSGMPLL